MFVWPGPPWLTSERPIETKCRFPKAFAGRKRSGRTRRSSHLLRTVRGEKPKQSMGVLSPNLPRLAPVDRGAVICPWTMC